MRVDDGAVWSSPQRQRWAEFSRVEHALIMTVDRALIRDGKTSCMHTGQNYLRLTRVALIMMAQAQARSPAQSEYEAELYHDLREGATRRRRREGLSARSSFTIPYGLSAKMTAYGDFVRSNASFVKFLEVQNHLPYGVFWALESTSNPHLTQADLCSFGPSL